jgi:hypothetical protein
MGNDFSTLRRDCASSECGTGKSVICALERPLLLQNKYRQDRSIPKIDLRLAMATSEKPPWQESSIIASAGKRTEENNSQSAGDKQNHCLSGMEAVGE